MSRQNLPRACALAAAVLGAALVAGPGARAQERDEWRAAPERTPVTYRIDATLATIDGESFPRLVKGDETIVWTNLSRERVATVVLHLYPNAFADERSAFLRERASDGTELPDPMVWGGCDVTNIHVPDSPGRQPTWAPVPFAGAPDDRTVLEVKLPQPVESGASVTLRITFTTTLPKPVARMGAVKDFVMAAQWYPKLGRHLGTDAAAPWKDRLVGGWYCHHYHAASEFAADFADFTVDLTTPKDWVVGATGTPAGDAVPGKDPATERRTWTATSVVDFAWAAGSRLRTLTRTIDPDDPQATDRVANEVKLTKTLLALDAPPPDLPAVEVVLLLQPEHLDQAERHFDAARVALALFGTWLGPYPYPRLTIVDPPHDAPVGGMEYPTLVTVGTSAGTPPGALRPEHVTVHEIGHQWFMNLLASNEAEEAWLDEGLTTWFTARAMDLAWGPATQHTAVAGLHFQTELPYTFPGVSKGWPDVLGLPAWMRPPDPEAFRLWLEGPMLASSQGLRYQPGQSPALPSRRSYLRSAGWDGVIGPGWEFASRGSHGGSVYPRSVLLLESIVRRVRERAVAERGEDGLRDADRRILRAFREYARRHRFAHPTTADLLKTLRTELAMPDLPQVFDTLARSTGLLDYAVESVRTVESRPRDAKPSDPPQLTSEIVVRRRGEVVVPVTVRVRVEGAEARVDLVWDGADRHRTFRVEGRVTGVAVDPARIHLQDANLSNNAWTDRQNPQPGVKWGVHAFLWLEHTLTSYGRFF